MQWVNSSGGPLILIEESKLLFWKGSEGSNSNEALTDYERACMIVGDMAILAVDGDKAVIFADDPMQTSWFSTSEYSGVMVRWRYAESESDVIDSLRSIHEIAWPDSGLEISFRDGRLNLFDSSFSGSEVDDVLRFTLNPGSFLISNAVYEPDQDTSLILYRFLRQ